MKPSRELRLDRVLLTDAGTMTDVLADQVAQDREKIRHGLTSARFTALHAAHRDALVGHSAGLLHQLCKSTAAQVRRPPQMHRRGDRRVNIVGAEDHSGTAHGSLDLRSVARHPFVLPLTHVRNDTGGACAFSPLPQTPTRRPNGRTSFITMALTGGPFLSIEVGRSALSKPLRF